MGALCILRKIIITWVEGPQCRRDGTSRNSDGTPTQSLKSKFKILTEVKVQNYPQPTARPKRAEGHKKQYYPSII
jgi:hypothetical protein